MGDTMLGRLVSQVIPQRDASSFWGTTLPILERCDLRLLNLETTITSADTRWTQWRKAFYYRAVPQAVDVLNAARIDYVNLANNHILDFSETGLRDTIRHVDGAQIRHTGAGVSLKQAARPVHFNLGSVTIGVFSFADHYYQWDAARRGAGVFFVSIPPPAEQWSRVKERIGQLRKAHDLVIVSVHWGPNMQEAPSSKVVRFAHRLVDAGVDVIHGHSAHVFHGLEIYRGKVILYDTGDFLDDYAVDRRMRNDYSFLYLLKLDGPRLAELELVPVKIDDRRVNLASPRERAGIFRLFEHRTRRFKTSYRIEKASIVIPVK